MCHEFSIWLDLSGHSLLNTLPLSGGDIKFIEQSPDCPNIKYCAQYLDKNEPLEASFSTLIEELKTMCGNTPRTLIYCQTRKQCSVLFRMFEVFLGHGIFQGTIKPQNRIVEMYHAGTSSRVKEHIVDNMASDEGHLRVLISTIAFGMGVNCTTFWYYILVPPNQWRCVFRSVDVLGEMGCQALVCFYTMVCCLHTVIKT